MIYLLSDFHADVNFAGLKKYVDNAADDDLLIVLGDIGLRFEKTTENRTFDEYFLSIKKNIAFLDGNHENFEYLNSFPEEEWNGGCVHRLTQNIVHLMRGNVYTINGKTFFVFGGCKSSPKWKEMGLWYFGEEPTEEEIKLAYAKLKEYDFHIDYIFTHKYEETSGCVQLRKLTEFIEENVRYEKWYAGHWHISKKKDKKHIFIYDELFGLE